MWSLHSLGLRLSCSPVSSYSATPSPPPNTNFLTFDVLGCISVRYNILEEQAIYRFVHMCRICCDAFSLNSTGAVSSYSILVRIPSPTPPTRATYVLARMLGGCRTCRATSPFSLLNWSASSLLCSVVLPVYPCVVSFCKVHEYDKHDLLRSSRKHPRPTRPFFAAVCDIPQQKIVCCVSVINVHVFD